MTEAETDVMGLKPRNAKDRQQHQRLEEIRKDWPLEPSGRAWSC